MKKCLLLVLFTLFISCSSESIKIDYDNTNIKYSGRIEYKIGADTYWPGTSVKINFEGESVFATLDDETGKNFFNILLDDKHITVLNLDRGSHTYQIAANLKRGKHTIELFRRTEWDYGRSSFIGFEIVGKAKILEKPIIKNRKFEFYGNSITAGYGVDDYEKDRPDSIFSNNYNAYGAVIARHYNAEYHCTAKGGIGIMVSWFPHIMPEVFNRINPNDENSEWDFSKYQPQIVVINLFQNDSWIVNMPDYVQFKNRFVTEKPSEDKIIRSYQNFVSTIRSKYPDANIICTLGAMDITKDGSKWPGYVTHAVENLNDGKIYSFFIKYKNSPGHPKVEEQKIMAAQLIRFIDENIRW